MAYLRHYLRQEEKFLCLKTHKAIDYLLKLSHSSKTFNLSCTTHVYHISNKPRRQRKVENLIQAQILIQAPAKS